MSVLRCMRTPHYAKLTILYKISICKNALKAAKGSFVWGGGGYKY